MGYTVGQARKLARQIFDRFDKRIVEAVNGTSVPPRFIAGLIGNEAGKDRQGNIVESATRFEPHVFAALKSVRDKGYRTVSGKKVSNYNGITKAQIADASDDAIRALSISYGATQIMGWHVINNLHCSIADLRNPDKHFFYTVKLLQLNGFPKNATKAQMDNEMRQWNTGRETGKTYHADYVPNAQLVRAEYAVLEQERVHRVVEERVDVPLDEIEADLDSTADNSTSYPTLDPAGSNTTVEDAGPAAGDPDTPASDPANLQSGVGSQASGVGDTFSAYLPQIDTAKSWVQRATAGTTLGAVIAVLAGAPLWVQIGLFVLVLTIVIGAIVMFIKYHDRIFGYVTQMNTLRATEGVGNPVVAQLKK